MSIVSEQAFHWESDQENGVRVCGGGVGENGSTTVARACLAEWDRYRGSPEKTQRGILCHTAVSTVCQGMSSLSKFGSMSLSESGKCNMAGSGVYIHVYQWHLLRFWTSTLWRHGFNR